MKAFTKMLTVVTMLFMLVASTAVGSSATYTIAPVVTSVDVNDAVETNTFLHSTVDAKRNKPLRPCRESRPTRYTKISPLEGEPVLMAGIKEFLACYYACRALGLTERDCVELCTPFLDSPSDGGPLPESGGQRKRKA